MASHIFRHHFQVYLCEIWMGSYLVGFVNQPYSPSSLFVWGYYSIFLLIVSDIGRNKSVSDLILRFHLKPSNLSPGSSHLVYRK